MKILYFYQYFTTPKGSYGTRCYEFTRRWVRAGHSVTVVTSVYDKSDLRTTRTLDRLDIEGVDVRVINVGLSNSHGFLRRVYSFLVYAAIASWYAISLPADVVVASSGPLTVGIPGQIAHYLRGRPLVFEVRDLWPEGAIQLGILRNRFLISLARWFERRCYRAADAIVALSQGMADWIRQHHGIDEIVVVTNACDNSLFERINGTFEPPPWAIGKTIVVYAGSLGYGDDCRQIIEMLGYLTEPQSADIELVLIGDGGERKALEQQAAQAGGGVRFLGRIPKKEVFGWLSIAGCALCTTVDVPFYATCSPNKMYDAFAAGVPMIQTTQGWIKDLLAREECGLTVPPNDPKAMAAAVTRVARDAELRKRLALNASRIASEQFDRDLLSQTFLETLCRVAGRTVEPAQVAA